MVLLTLEGAVSADAVLAFLRGPVGGRVVLVGRSAPFRPGAGGPLRQAWRHLRRSGPRLLPFLVANYALPGWAAALRRGPGALAALCAARGVPAAGIADVNGPEAHAVVCAARPDLLVTLHFDQILAPATIGLARLGGVNLHPSLLPRHRGPVPTVWALAEEPPSFGVTVHRLVPRIDAGPVLAQAAVPLPAGTTASAAARALHAAGVPLLERAVLALEAGTAEEREAPPMRYCPFPSPAVLRGVARRGRRLVDAADWRAALRVRVG